VLHCVWCIISQTCIGLVIFAEQLCSNSIFAEQFCSNSSHKHLFIVMFEASTLDQSHDLFLIFYCKSACENSMPWVHDMQHAFFSQYYSWARKLHSCHQHCASYILTLLMYTTHVQPKTSSDRPFTKRANTYLFCCRQILERQIHVCNMINVNVQIHCRIGDKVAISTRWKLKDFETMHRSESHYTWQDWLFTPQQAARQREIIDENIIAPQNNDWTVTVHICSLQINILNECCFCYAVTMA